MTVDDWAANQDQFAQLRPILPKPWIRILSRSTKDMYYYNTETKQSRWTEPDL